LKWENKLIFLFQGNRLLTIATAIKRSMNGM